jgi:short-subunit dehydrogenase
MRTAVVTGGTKGIGRAIVERLVRDGYGVAIAARTAADLEETREAMRAINPEREIIICAADLAKKKEVERFAAMIRDAWRQVDVLVNNAGHFVPG